MNGWTPADGSIQDALAEASDGIDDTLANLDQMDDAYQQLLPLVDIVLEKDGITEVGLGQVSESDIQRYFAVMGDYIDNSRQGLLATKDCYSQSPRLAVACSVEYSSSAEAQDALATVTELDRLQFKLFGQHLIPTG